MERRHRESAEQMRSVLATVGVAPAVFRAALTGVPAVERDAWVNVVLGLDAAPDDGPDLPRGCVPYLPCPVDALLRLSEHAGMEAGDVFVDLGCGVGRAAALIHLLTGASVIGIEVQRALVVAARDLAERMKLARFVLVEGDAAELTGLVGDASVFFLYCPFGGERLERVLDALERIARTRRIRVGCVDLPLPARPWLELVAASGDLAVYRSTW